MSEQTNEHEQHLPDEINVYDITTIVDLIQAYFHYSTRQVNINQRNFLTPQNNTRLPIDTWSKRLQDDRRMWIIFSKEWKALKLGLKPPPNTNNTDTRQSMLNNISAFEFINRIDDTFSDEHHEDVLNNGDGNTLLANTTSVQAIISPADIRNVLLISSNYNSLPQTTNVPSTWYSRKLCSTPLSRILYL